MRDSKGQILNQKEDIGKGIFSTSTENFEKFEICFISRVPPSKFVKTIIKF